MSDGGKGDNQRPTDYKSFSEGYDRIFSGKPTRGRFVQDPVSGKLVPFDEWAGPSTSHSAYVAPDIQPYRSTITGEMITSRSQHREHLKRHNCFEIGNEVDAMMKAARPEPKIDREGIRRTLAEVLTAKGIR